MRQLSRMRRFVDIKLARHHDPRGLQVDHIDVRVCQQCGPRQSICLDIGSRFAMFDKS